MHDELEAVLAAQQQVASVEQLLALMSRSRLRALLASGRWQRVRPAVVVAHSGPVTPTQELWAALLASGPAAVLGGLCASRHHGLRGFEPDRIDVLVPHGVRRKAHVGIALHQSGLLAAADVLRNGLPRTRPARSIVDAATWARSDRYATAIVLAAVQQRVVRPDDVVTVLAQRHNTRRRPVLFAAVQEAATGSHTLGELDVIRLCREAGLPEPRRQSRRRDADGRVRYYDLDLPDWRLVIEIDGAGHLDPLTHWDDVARDNALVADGWRVLRFSSAVLRERPDYVVACIERRYTQQVGPLDVAVA